MSQRLTRRFTRTSGLLPLAGDLHVIPSQPVGMVSKLRLVRDRMVPSLQSLEAMASIVRSCGANQGQNYAV